MKERIKEAMETIRGIDVWDVSDWLVNCVLVEMVIVFAISIVASVKAMKK